MCQILIDVLQIVDLRLNATSDEEEEEDDTNQASATTSPPSQSEFLFTSISSSTDTPLKHPSLEHVTLLFDLYLTNMDPIYKVLHKPTLELFVKEAVQDLGSIPGGRPMEALMFVIYFASINSLTKEQCFTLFGEERSVLWARSKQNAERALVKADLLNSTELPTLQAFVIFLVSSSLRFPDSRTTYTCPYLIPYLSVQTWSLSTLSGADGLI